MAYSVIPRLLFHMFRRSIMYTSSASIMRRNGILVFGRRIVTPILRKEDMYVLLIRTITIMVLLNRHGRALMITFILRFIRLLHIIDNLRVNRQDVGGAFLNETFILLLFNGVLFRLLHGLVRLLDGS